MTSVCKLLASEGDIAEPLTQGELSRVLWFVETCVTSNKLFFDGTVPQETGARALDAVEELKEGCEVKLFQVSAITVDSPKAALDAARDAMAESRLLLDHFTFSHDIDKPLDQNEYENFFGRLNLALSSPSECESLAQEWVSDGFRGGKCLAGLIANGDEMLATARLLYDQHPGQGALVTAALINRFRLNYVNHLAASKHGAYVPDPGFESVTNEHIRLFKDYLIEQVQKQVKAGPDDANIIVDNMKSKDPLPRLACMPSWPPRRSNVQLQFSKRRTTSFDRTTA